jgi:hypothetical protein
MNLQTAATGGAALGRGHKPTGSNTMHTSGRSDSCSCGGRKNKRGMYQHMQKRNIGRCAPAAWRGLWDSRRTPRECRADGRGSSEETRRLRSIILAQSSVRAVSVPIFFKILNAVLQARLTSSKLGSSKVSDPAQMHAQKLQDHDGGYYDAIKATTTTATRLQRHDSAEAASLHLRNKKLWAVVHNDQGRRRRRDARPHALHETRQNQNTVDLGVLLHIYPLFHLTHIHIVRTHHISLSNVFKCITDNASVSCCRVWQAQAAAEQRP